MAMHAPPSNYEEIRGLLENMQRLDAQLDHSPESCAQCHYQFLMAEVARDLVARSAFDLHEWNIEVDRRWRTSKFVALWDAESDAGRDPKDAFRKRGWVV